MEATAGVSDSQALRPSLDREAIRCVARANEQVLPQGSLPLQADIIWGHLDNSQLLPLLSHEHK